MIDKTLHKNTISYYFLSGAVEGALALALVLLIPPDPKNKWFLGYSQGRVLMAAAVLAAIFIFLLLSFVNLKKPGFTRKISQKLDASLDVYGGTLPILLLTFGLFVIGPYLKTLTYLPSDEIKTRLLPFVLYLCSRFLQFIVALGAALQTRKKQERRWKLSRRNLIIILATITGILVTAHLSIFAIHEITQGARRYKDVWQLNRYFNLTYEMNFPAFFSSFLLGLAGFVLGVIALNKVKQGDKLGPQWSLLSAIFFYLAFDELLALHEDLGYLANEYFGRENLVFQDWAYAGIIIVAVFAILFWPFFKHLPPQHKWRFFVAAALYVGGALGVEIIGSMYEIRNGIQGIPYLAFTTTEETLEMVGTIYFINALLLYREELGHAQSAQTSE